VSGSECKLAEEPDWEFLTAKARGWAIAVCNRIVVDLDSWADLPALDELDPADRARVEAVLDGAQSDNNLARVSESRRAHSKPRDGSGLRARGY
jgi:hypothetical protein